jgi:hypothetical protein
MVGIFEDIGDGKPDVSGLQDLDTPVPAPADIGS